MTISSNFKMRAFSGVAMVSALLAIAGCGEKESSGQVAAKVNSGEITVSQIASSMSQLPPVPPEQASLAKRAVLDKLVEQQLFIQQAVSDKLDRTPKVVEDIEAAKRAILARAYLEKIVSGVSQPTSEDVGKYYDAHPELFSQRRIYNVQDCEIVPQAGMLPFLKDEVAKGLSLDDIGAALKARGAKFSIRSGMIAPEQAPLELLPKLRAIQDGQSGVIEGPNSISVIHVVSSTLQPVELKTAQNAIKSYLQNKGAKDAVDTELKRLKAEAKVEYLGEFAKAPSAQSEQKKDSEAAAQSAPAASGADIAKGIEGLK